jgi:hypothetical protein
MSRVWNAGAHVVRLAGPLCAFNRAAVQDLPLHTSLAGGWSRERRHPALSRGQGPNRDGDSSLSHLQRTFLLGGQGAAILCVQTFRDHVGSDQPVPSEVRCSIFPLLVSICIYFPFALSSLLFIYLFFLFFRSVQYFEQVYVKGRVPSPKAMVLREVIMHTIPNFDKGCSPYVEIFSTSTNSPLSAPPQG